MEGSYEETLSEDTAQTNSGSKSFLRGHLLPSLPTLRSGMLRDPPNPIETNMWVNKVFPTLRNSAPTFDLDLGEVPTGGGGSLSG